MTDSPKRPDRMPKVGFLSWYSCRIDEGESLAGCSGSWSLWSYSWRTWPVWGKGISWGSAGCPTFCIASWPHSFYPPPVRWYRIPVRAWIQSHSWTCLRTLGITHNTSFQPTAIDFLPWIWHPFYAKGHQSSSLRSFCMWRVHFKWSTSGSISWNRTHCGLSSSNLLWATPHCIIWASSQRISSTKDPCMPICLNSAVD